MKKILFVMLLLALTVSVWAETSHSKMNHGEMDHSKMDHSMMNMEGMSAVNACSRSKARQSGSCIVK